MSVLIQNLFSQICRKGPAKQQTVVSDEPNAPFICTALIYLKVFLIAGPIIYYTTCLPTRYPLPDATQLQTKLYPSHDKFIPLHLDVSVVQLSRYQDAELGQKENLHDEQANYLRQHLSKSITTSIENVTYNVDWRVRRPTRDENFIFQSHQQSNTFSSTSLTNLEKKLVQLHKTSRKFRLFIYLIQEQYRDTYCNSTYDYVIGHERIVYICPSTGAAKNRYDVTANSIERAIGEIYSDTIDPVTIKHVTNDKLELALYLMPETTSNVDDMLRRTRSAAEKLHTLYAKNMRDKFSDLKEILNLRVVSENVYELIDDVLLTSVAKKKDTNDTEIMPRLMSLNGIDKLRKKFELRVDKPLADNVHKVIIIIPDEAKGPLFFESGSEQYLVREEDGRSSYLIINDDESLALGFRSILRKVMGLKSPNLCPSCRSNRAVIFNHWELDAIMGSLTIKSLETSRLSLATLSQEISSLRIPEHISTNAFNAYDLASESISLLSLKKTHEAFRKASRAAQLSESASRSPEVLVVDFPTDLKIYVYIPLIGTLVLPFLDMIVELYAMMFGSLRRQ